MLNPMKMPEAKRVHFLAGENMNAKFRNSFSRFFFSFLFKRWFPIKWCRLSYSIHFQMNTDYNQLFHFTHQCRLLILLADFFLARNKSLSIEFDSMNRSVQSIWGRVISASWPHKHRFFNIKRPNQWFIVKDCMKNVML